MWNSHTKIRAEQNKNENVLLLFTFFYSLTYPVQQQVKNDKTNPPQKNKINLYPCHNLANRGLINTEGCVRINFDVKSSQNQI